MRYWWTYVDAQWVSEPEHGELNIRRRGLFWRWSVDDFNGGETGLAFSLHKAMMLAETSHEMHYKC